jgi:hypothetical protein
MPTHPLPTHRLPLTRLLPLAPKPLALPRLLPTPPLPLLTPLATLLPLLLAPPPTLLPTLLPTLPSLLKTWPARPRTLLKKPRSNNFCFDASLKKPLVRQRLFLCPFIEVGIAADIAIAVDTICICAALPCARHPFHRSVQ